MALKRRVVELFLFSFFFYETRVLQDELVSCNESQTMVYGRPNKRQNYNLNMDTLKMIIIILLTDLLIQIVWIFK